MTITSLWLPIIASAVVVFIAGSIVWMFMPWHKTEWKKTPDEEALRAALKSCPPGMYTVPNVKDQAEFKNPDVQKKLVDGPQAFVTVVPSGLPKMGPKLVMNFGYNLVVAIVCAYFVSRTLAPGADYLAVFRIAGAVAFVAYGMAYVQESVWFGRKWSSTGMSFLDALIYGLLTGGVFGWLA
jgi:hypothetical protein